MQTFALENVNKIAVNELITVCEIHCTTSEVMTMVYRNVYNIIIIIS